MSFNNRDSQPPSLVLQKKEISICRFSKTIRYFYQVLLDYYGFFIANI